MATDAKISTKWDLEHLSAELDKGRFNAWHIPLPYRHELTDFNLAQKTQPPAWAYDGKTRCLTPLRLMTHHHGALLLFIPLFLFGARPVVSYAQSALPLDRFEGEDGLSHDWILAIAQDNQGFLWIGTSDGLNRYDGYEFVVYQHQPGDTTSLRQNMISDLVLDANGDLWVAAGGLHRLDRSTGHLLRYDLGLDPYIDIPQMAADGHGNLWIAAETGVLYRYDILRDTLVGPAPSTPGIYPYHIGTS